MMRNFCLAALDLDDTLFDAHGTLTEASRAALSACAAHGIVLVIASGRPYAALPHEILTLPGVSWAITSNGAAVLEHGIVRARFCLPPEAAGEILSRFSGETLECVVDGWPYCEKSYLDALPSGARADYLRRTRLPAPSTAALIDSHRDRLDAVNIYVRDEAHRSACLARAAALPGLYVTSSSPHLVEISDRRAGKDAALRFVCKQLGIPLSDTAAFGNGDNDAAMLRAAGLGVAVANATPACLAAADHICPPNEEDGVAETLLKLLK